MMGHAKGPQAAIDTPQIGIERGVDHGGLDLLFFGEWRQDARHALGEQGLARTRRTHHDDAVIPANCYLQRTLGRIMTDHVREIERIVALFWFGEAERGQFFARDLTQVFEREAFHP